MGVNIDHDYTSYKIMIKSLHSINGFLVHGTTQVKQDLPHESHVKKIKE